MSYYIRKSDKQTYRSVIKIANTLGFAVKAVPANFINGAMGKVIITSENKYILVSETLSIEEMRLTIAHELAHIVLGHFLFLEDEQFKVPGDQAEFEAESLGFILYNFLYGIDGGKK